MPAVMSHSLRGDMVKVASASPAAISASLRAMLPEGLHIAERILVQLALELGV